MGKLIDTDALIAKGKIEAEGMSEPFKTDFAVLVEWLVDKTPEAVVRCRDCKYQNKGSNEADSWNLCKLRPWLYIPISDDYFCSYGERRTNE